MSGMAKARVTKEVQEVKKDKQVGGLFVSESVSVIFPLCLFSVWSGVSEPCGTRDRGGRRTAVPSLHGFASQPQNGALKKGEGKGMIWPSSEVHS
jgi:hypothetical protein